MEKALGLCNDSGQLLISIKSAGISNLASNLQVIKREFSEAIKGVEELLPVANDGAPESGKQD